MQKPQLMYKKNLCIHCGRCLEFCGHSECEDFERCVHACPNGCLSVSGYCIEASELAERLLKNEKMLNALKGGITVSGGEPLMQSDFVCELVTCLNGINAAIQTSGYADFEVYKKTVDKFDYIMQDIKLADKNMHEKYTGVSNEKILKNIEYLKNSGKQFVFRVPLIPSITDTPENLKAISRIAGDFPVQLLRYNTLAGAKYEMLGLKYQLGDAQNGDDDLRKYFSNAKYE